METKKTTITLLSWTQFPRETIYAEWIQSRTTDRVPMPWETAHEIATERLAAAKKQFGDEERWLSLTHGEKIDFMKQAPAGFFEEEVNDVFQKVVDMKMPLGEHLDFIFLVENCSVALREQMVRHRIGHKFGEKLGADIVPDLAGGSSFWSQTTRIIDMGQFATNGEYLKPDWIPEVMQKEMSVGQTVGEYYDWCMSNIQRMYQDLCASGMPMEDARNVLPVGMQHRLTWKVNFSALAHILPRRGCWLAQLGMWKPVIEGIVEELSKKVHPSFRRLIDPPCIGKSGEYEACVFGKENEEVIQNGNYPPCSLWVNKEASKDFRQCVSEKQVDRYHSMQERYAALWQRNPVTGERMKVG